MEWVVTYRIEQCDNCGWGLAEFYRGTEEECRRISDAFAGGASDLVKTKPWCVIIGPAAGWDLFLLDGEYGELT
jgi:hypothetical protein